MGFDSWTCLMVEKGPGTIDDDVRSDLKLAACDLNMRKHDRMNIVSDVCDGVLSPFRCPGVPSEYPAPKSGLRFWLIQAENKPLSNARRNAH